MFPRFELTRFFCADILSNCIDNRFLCDLIIFGGHKFSELFLSIMLLKKQFALNRKESNDQEYNYLIPSVQDTKGKEEPT